MKNNKTLSIIKTLVLAAILTIGVQYVFAQTWQAPTGSPPQNNTYAPLNVGTSGQLKNGGLTLGFTVPSTDPALIIPTGRVSVGAGTAPQEKIHVVGTPTAPGRVRADGFCLPGISPTGGCISQWPTGGTGSGVTCALGGPCTINKLLKFATASTVKDSLIFDNGNQIGINTSAPRSGSALDVNGKTTTGTLGITAQVPGSLTVGPAPFNSPDTLHVKGSIGAEAGGTNGGELVMRNSSKGGTSASKWILRNMSNSANGDSFQAWSVAGNGNVAPRLVIDDQGDTILAPSGGKVILTPPTSQGGFVGIGTMSPKADLHVTGNNGYGLIRVSNRSNQDPVGNSSLQLYKYDPDASGEPSRWSGWAFVNDNNGNLRINRDIRENVSGGDSAIFVDYDSKRLGINVQYPNADLQATLDVGGSIRIRGVQGDTPQAGEVLTAVNSTGLAEWRMAPGSDISLKTNIKSLGSAVLDKVLKLRGVSFNWKDREDKETRIGFIAQEVEKVFPEVVFTESDGKLSVDYDKLAAPMVEAIKAQQDQISAQQAQIEAQQSQINTLTAQMRALQGQR